MSWTITFCQLIKQCTIQDKKDRNTWHHICGVETWRPRRVGATEGADLGLKPLFYTFVVSTLTNNLWTHMLSLVVKVLCCHCINSLCSMVSRQTPQCGCVSRKTSDQSLLKMLLTRHGPNTFLKKIHSQAIHIVVVVGRYYQMISNSARLVLGPQNPE